MSERAGEPVALSAIVPAYNESGRIGATVRSIRSALRALLGHERFEILVADDGSTDDTAAEARQAGATEVLLLPHSGKGAAARPALIGVDGGAEVLREHGYTPDIILGDMDSATDTTLRCGAELVVHTYADDRPSPGWERVQQLGLPAHALPAPGTSEDVAMLLAYHGGAELIVAVGTHFSFVEFLDKRRAGMASTFVTRLKVGGLLVDAKGVSRLYRPAVSPGQVAVLILSALAPIAVIALHSPAVQRWLSVVGVAIKLWWRRLGLG